MTKTPDISPEVLEMVLAFAADKAKKTKGKKREKVAPEVSEARRAANDAECIKVFTEAGYSDVQPRVNVLTYGKVKKDGTVTGWLAKGRKVRTGEKSLQVGPFRLFHVDQTEEIKTDGTVH